MHPHPIYPEVLMTTEAVESILGDASYRIFEVDLDPAEYEEAHVPGAMPLDWELQLRNPETNEILTPEEFSELLGKCGVKPGDKIVLYGDNNNWFACWAYWLLYMVGHEEVWLMDGGKKKWFAEGRPVTSEVPEILSAKYPLKEYSVGDKATIEDVFEAMFSPDTHRLIDVRSALEFSGELLGPAGAPVRCAVGGHIPTSINIPWNLNCNTDGTFKGPDSLSDLYRSFNVTEDSVVITYCAIGERASLSWFVLKNLLGHEVVMNYDRSMAQWSRIANAPMIGKEAA